MKKVIADWLRDLANWFDPKPDGGPPPAPPHAQRPKGGPPPAPPPPKP